MAPKQEAGTFLWKVWEQQKLRCHGLGFYLTAIPYGLPSSM
ncbi:Hypothetical protein I595_2745 [Croceitalea dokdonensis DOKDO 023]|uniref:Uncharacterized protein n=1 Tax=Croceitalea dokdonensis DOKDO 023 TaxID=1300341 RepID=A0A0P7ASY2_9FLAO|nr:Hypothetical protein I595_2745 [Croceitalea dokdonensis DOKDO 023]